MDPAELARIARGDEPPDLVLRGGSVVDVAAGEVIEQDVAIAGDRIVGLGPGYEAREMVDVAGAFVAPAFIEGHLHVESSLLTPDRFGPLVAARGTGTVISDPHEIANVCGAAGIRWMLAAGRDAPVDIRIMLSSCVPASPLGTAGAQLDADDLLSLADEEGVSGLAEVMSFPLVVAGEPDVTAKLRAFQGRVIDGHAPGLRGMGLNAYVAAGPSSEHECTTAEEAQEKLRRGMRIMVREGSTAKNLEALIGLVTPANARRFMLVTDDRHVSDLLRVGHLDHQLRMAVAAGVDPVTAVGMVTLNAAEHFRLHDRGLIAPGRRADVVVLEDLRDFRARLVYHEGRLVAREGTTLGEVPAPPPPPPSAVRVDPGGAPLRLTASPGRLRAIGVVEGQIVTEALEVEPIVRDGAVVADPGSDLLKLCVFERHRGTGNVGVGFVRGLGLERGAFASTVAHDCHNLVVAGAGDEEIRHAAQVVAEMGGGLCAVAGGQTLASLALPVAGLMSERAPDEVAAAHDALHDAARALGSRLTDPFMQLAFLALEVIPSLKLSDRGLVDVERFALTEPFTA